MTSLFILFDLDNTLYPASSQVLQTIDRRITRFTAEFLSLTEEEADSFRRDTYHRYGTTLRWLQVVHNLKDPEDYLKKVHPQDLGAYLSPDKELRQMVLDLPCPYALVTNSPREHAARALEALGVEDLFPRIWDIRRVGFQGKPRREAYHRVLGDLGLSPREVLLIEDSLPNLRAFRALGGRGILVDEKGDYTGEEFPVIQKIHTLPSLL